MRKCLTAGLLGLCLVGAASAQSYGYNNHGSYGYNQNSHNNDHCAKERRRNQTGGAIVGGLLGAVAGGAIGNNIDGDDDRYHRRGYRGYRGYGYGYGRHYRHRNNDNSGKVAAGAVIGGLLGAVAGSEVGKRNVNCNTYHDSINTRGYRGDPNIAPPTRQAWPEQTRAYPVSQPSTPRTYPTQPRQPDVQWPVYEGDVLSGGQERCETLTRVTRLPDGREIREAVQSCQDGDVWYERDGRRVQGGY